MRDSKNPIGPILEFAPTEWAGFTGGVRDGKFDLCQRPADTFSVAVCRGRNALNGIGHGGMLTLAGMSGLTEHVGLAIDGAASRGEDGWG